MREKKKKLKYCSINEQRKDMVKHLAQKKARNQKLGLKKTGLYFQLVKQNIAEKP